MVSQRPLTGEQGPLGFLMNLIDSKFRTALWATTALCASGSAFAGPGEHIRVGDTTITPTIGLATDLDTNATQSPSDPVTGVSFLLRPTLSIESEGATTSLNLYGQHEARKFASSNLQQLDRVRDFKFVGDLDALKNSTVGFQLGQALQVLSDPNDSAAGYTYEGTTDTVIFEDASAYNTRLANITTASTVFRLGPTLVLKTAGNFTFDDYRSPVGAQYSLESTNRRSGYGPNGEVAWTFFPRTAVVLSGSYTLYRWANNTLDASGDSGGLGEVVVIPNSNHLKMEAGLRGRLTERLVVVVMAGYGSADYLTDDATPGVTGAEADAAAVGFDADVNGLEGLLVSGQTRYRIGASQNFSATYLKNFTDVFFTNYASFHDIGLGWDGNFGERLTAAVGASVRLENYKGEVTRQDQRVRVAGNTGFKVADWSTVTLTAAYLQRISSSDSVSFADFNTQLSFNFVY